jgi:hypothetical protein
MVLWCRLQSLVLQYICTMLHWYFGVLILSALLLQCIITEVHRNYGSLELWCIGYIVHYNYGAMGLHCICTTVHW